jgi:hypothetical protein
MSCLNYPLLIPCQGENESTPVLDESYIERILEPGMVEKLVKKRAFPAKWDPFFVLAFLYT